MKKRFIFALFLSHFILGNHQLQAQSSPYLSSLGSFSVSDTVKIWAHIDDPSYSLITLENQTATTIDIGFIWDTISPFPSLWGAEIEYPLSNGYTSAKTGQFRLFANGGGSTVPLIFFAFSHHNQAATGAARLHLYQINQPQDSINVHFEMTSRPLHHISVENVPNAVPLDYHIYPNPAENWLYLRINSLSDINIEEPTHIYVFSPAGGLVLCEKITNPNDLIRVNIHSLPAGYYTLQLQRGKFNLISPFIKN